MTFIREASWTGTTRRRSATSRRCINTPNGYGHRFGSFSNPDAAYLNDVERLISMASGRSLKVGIVVAWDGPNQYSVENGKLTTDNAYQYGTTIAAQWTRPGFSGRSAIAAWIMGGDTTNDCCGGEHGAVWPEVVRGIEDAQAANGFSGPQILLHTAPGQHLNYVGASWLDAHAPQTGHCADAGTGSTGCRSWPTPAPPLGQRRDALRRDLLVLQRQLAHHSPTGSRRRHCHEESRDDEQLRVRLRPPLECLEPRQCRDVCVRGLGRASAHPRRAGPHPTPLGRPPTDRAARSGS
ncbi:MAG: DUF4038 domain-containing protein [Acidimicrobiia bacterium]|nr:DUF4038 domain-containing protein [Acidimicrobiia bacterium]